MHELIGMPGGSYEAGINTFDTANVCFSHPTYSDELFPLTLIDILERILRNRVRKSHQSIETSS